MTDTPNTGSGEIDDVTGTPTTGHEWDGIKELNTPLPRWWLWTFYATVIWSIGYVILYPAIPLVNKATPGLLGYNTRSAVAEDIATAREAQGAFVERIANSTLDDIRQDPDLLRFAVAGGESAFQVNCSPCHGSGAAGSPGYPNLNDDEWIWGGTLEAIQITLLHGVRFARDDDTRQSQMPAFGADGILDRDQIGDVAAHVLAIVGREHDAGAAERGATLYADNCAACHGEAGEGNHELGAPALNDAIWLYGDSTAEIRRQISQPRHGVMPGWAERLDPVTIKQLTLYVHGLGGGQEAAPQ